ncbi:MAG: hypothetical protein M3350_11100 [Actinomycetota bacterium]|nr:hypothetical protein [Actinomycetota bacterium]MDQ3721307.1 hypothetical protein [Actinomycetota bacterium]
MTRRSALLGLLVVVLAVPASAGAAPSKDLWATVNACDSPTFPDRVGIRASMPGDGTGKRMYARFRLQYYSAMRDGWQPVTGGRSPKFLLGSARRDRQGGYTFQVNPPAPGGSFLVRGVANLEWQKKAYRIKRVRVKRGSTTVVRRKRVFRGWVVAKRSRQITRAGVTGVKGGDGVSLASCTVR